LIHGNWTGRWYASEALEEALPRVHAVPMTIGDWQGEDLSVDAEAYAQAGAQAYWMRRYKHISTGATVSVILMCGRGGKMSVHTPDVCYQGAGYGLVGQPKRVTIAVTGAPEGEFWTGGFAKEKTGGAALRLYWAWGAGGRWQAPDVPRFTFRGQPFLYKLYVIREHVTGAETPEAGPAVNFLQQLLPQLDKTLFSGSSP
jgi:hypothetical protein